MGSLSECKICKLDNSVCYKGYLWARDDGTLEAFWHEAGLRVTRFFDAKGKQLGAWKQYALTRE